MEEPRATAMASAAGGAGDTCARATAMGAIMAATAAPLTAWVSMAEKRKSMPTVMMGLRPHLHR